MQVLRICYWHMHFWRLSVYKWKINLRMVCNKSLYTSIWHNVWVFLTPVRVVHSQKLLRICNYPSKITCMNFNSNFVILLQPAAKWWRKTGTGIFCHLPIKAVKRKLVIFVKKSNSILFFFLLQCEKIKWNPIRCINARNFVDVFVITNELHIDDSHDSEF